MKMKKLFAALMSMAMMAGFAGCSSTSSSSSSSSSSASTTVAETTTTAAQSSSADADGETIARIKEDGVLKVATGNYMPFEYRDEKNNIVGYDIDVAQIIADKLGVKLEAMDMTFTSIIPSVQNGEYDLAIAAMYDTEARREVVLMSDSYMETGMVMVTLANDTAINELSDLQGKKVGVKTGATSEKVANDLKEENNWDFEVLSYTETTGCIADLEAGRVDVVINDLLNQLEFNKTNKNLKVVGEPFTSANLSIAVSKDSPDLMELVNDTIAEIKGNGKAEELYQKWIIGE